MRAAGCPQRFEDKPADIFGVQPCSAQPDGDLAGGEVDGLHLRVSAIFDNYIYDYAYIAKATLTEAFGAETLPNTAYIRFPSGADTSASGATLRSIDGVSNVLLSEEMKTRVGSMLDSLNYIVLIVLVCAGALSFIVLYNLTNITIAERTRELATVKVLGFYPNEAAHYVFRENLILTGAGAVFGLGLGVALHAFVMNAIKVDMMYFKPHISFLSFAVSIVITFVFAMIVNAIMRRRIDNIDMAGALKSIE